MPVDNPYRVVICDLRSDQLLDVLPVTGLSFDDYIGKTGTCSGTIEITDKRVAERIRLNFIPARTAIYIYRDKSIWWGGILWTRTPATDERGFVKVAFQASTFDSYFEHRRVFDTQTFVGEDQLDIVRGLLDYAQGQTGGDIGIVYDQLISGVGRDRTYLNYDLPIIREQIDLLSNVDNGFEWRMRAYSASNGARVRNLQLGYPKIRVGSEDIVLSSPGEIVKYSLPEDGTTVANYWQSRGASINQDASEDSTPLMSTRYFYPQDLDAGWPRLDGNSDYSTVSEIDTLNAQYKGRFRIFKGIEANIRADGTVDMEPHELRQFEFVVIPEIDVLLGSGKISPSILGASIRVRIKDIWYYEGIVQRYRIIGVKISPAERGKPESASLYLEKL